VSAPLVNVLTQDVPAVSTAGNDDTTVLFQAPFAGTITAVQYTAEAAVTGANTNSRTLSLTNRGQAGAGSTTVASLALVSGVNLVAYDEKTITLSGTAADLVVAEGDTLSWTSLHVGTGITDPGGTVKVTFSRS
jgi:hypothetical protein